MASSKRSSSAGPASSFSSASSIKAPDDMNGRSTRPLRILQIVNTLALADGGPARNAWELFNAFPEGASQSLVWIHGDRRESLAREVPANLNGHPMWGMNERHAALRLARALMNSDVLVIHGYYLWWAAAAALTARAFGHRVLLTPHGSLTTYQQSFSRGKKRVFEFTAGWILRHCVEAFVTGSARESRELQSRFPRTAAFKAGVGTPLRSAPIAKTAWGREVQLLSVSRIAPKKRVDLMIEALHATRRLGISSRLTIAGDGDPNLLRELEQLASKLGVEDFVDFVGLRSGGEIDALFASADVFVAPSDDENFGIASAEALAAGLPVIVSQAVDALHDIDGDFVVKLADRRPETIAAAVQSLLGRDRSSLVRQAFLASQRFGWAAVADRWVQIARQGRSSSE